MLRIAPPLRSFPFVLEHTSNERDILLAIHKHMLEELVCTCCLSSLRILRVQVRHALADVGFMVLTNAVGLDAAFQQKVFREVRYLDLPQHESDR